MLRIDWKAGSLGSMYEDYIRGPHRRRIGWALKHCDDRHQAMNELSRNTPASRSPLECLTTNVTLHLPSHYLHSLPR